MAATNNVPVTLDTPIVVKVLFRGQTKKFKLPLKDLGAHVLPGKLRAILSLQPEQDVLFERYSDSAASYVTLDADKPQVYKTLFRAAKAKLKLRLRVSIPGEEPVPPPTPAPAAPHSIPAEAPPAREMSSNDPTPQANVTASLVIAHSPDSKAEQLPSPVSPPKVADNEEEAHVPQAFIARNNFFNQLAATSGNSGLAFRPKPACLCPTWVVYCNNCNEPMEDEHFHCSVCDGGDYDLCPKCVDNGVHCPGTGHWMVKRFVKNGNVVNSTTQRIAPKTKAEAEEPQEQEVPGAFTDEKQSVVYAEEPTRTCNCCVKILPEREFVTCVACEDYDLCLQCHINNKHGHHPGHAFKPATSETVLPSLADFLCNSGRNVRHSAVCDGCDKFIYGVRHKCLNCPDWDYCGECVKNAKFIHPRHRFVPIYEPLAEPMNSSNRHYGIYCDGPLCKDKENLSYIEGIRYKCAVCHDTDFCQNCEAHPSNKHNHTHPLIKFQTPVRSVSVTTVNDDKEGRLLARLGDRLAARRSTATETTATAPSTNAATQVQTIVDMKPEESQAKKEKITISDLLVDSIEPVQEKVVVPAEEKPVKSEAIPIRRSEPAAEGLDAHFIRDTIVDGSRIPAGATFTQTWTLRNPGPNAWPAGCSVRHVGGDNMLNIDNTRPLSHTDLAEASESNVLCSPVQPGEEAHFRVVMKAPQREGTAISYWRLKTPAGMPFGHRLWCDIAVVATPPSVDPQMAAHTAAFRSGSATTYEVAPRSNPMYERLIQARAERERVKNMRQTHLQQLEQSHQQKMEQVQRVRKAAVERVLELRRKEHEAALASIKQEPVPSPQPEVAPEEPAAELPSQEKPSEPAAEPSSSGMIFPQLEKESPESSAYQSSTTAQPMSPVSEKSTVARTVTVASDEEFFEDAESVALQSDDGFMTDEEYDILDASDEEMS